MKITPETDANEYGGDIFQHAPATVRLVHADLARKLERERNQWKANHDNQVKLKRIIAARPDLKERAPMVEKLMQERNRAQAHSIRQHERIKQLENVPTKQMLADLLERVKSGEEAPEDVAEYRHLAGEISAWGAKFAEAMRRRDERASRKRKSSENAESIHPESKPNDHE